MFCTGMSGGFPPGANSPALIYDHLDISAIFLKGPLNSNIYLFIIHVYIYVLYLQGLVHMRDRAT